MRLAWFWGAALPMVAALQSWLTLVFGNRFLND
jgi:hypothetical protein